MSWLRWMVLLPVMGILLAQNACVENETTLPITSVSEKNHRAEESTLPDAEESLSVYPRAIHLPIAHNNDFACEAATDDALILRASSHLPVWQLFAPVSGIVSLHQKEQTPDGKTHLHIGRWDETFVAITNVDEVFVKDNEEVTAGQLLASARQSVILRRLYGEPYASPESADMPLSLQLIVEQYGDGRIVAESPEIICERTHEYYSALPIAHWHPDGTILLQRDDQHVFRIDNGRLGMFLDLEDVLTSGHHVRDAVLVSPQEAECYDQSDRPIASPGMVDAVRDLSSGELWLVIGTQDHPERYRIRVRETGWESVLASWGLEYDATSPPPEQHGNENRYLEDWPAVEDTFARLRDGALVREASSTDVYAISNGAALLIKDWQTYLLLGFSNKRILVLPDDAFEIIQGTLGSCDTSDLCIDRAQVAHCQSLP